jgi:hypothetical protein
MLGDAFQHVPIEAHPAAGTDDEVDIVVVEDERTA